MEDDKSPGEKEREPAKNQERSDASASRVKATVDEESGNSKKEQNPEQRWKIIREWLTIGGLFGAAAAACYQIVILSQQASLLSKQANAMSGQLEEMKHSAIQTDKLISSNADLAAAAKAQALAEQQSAATAHDTLILSQRGQIASVNASLEALQNGQPAKAVVEYSNVGREPTPVDAKLKIKKWSKAEWSDPKSVQELYDNSARCMAIANVYGSMIANPSTGFGSDYKGIVDSSIDQIQSGTNFLVDDEVLKGDAVITVTACYIYRTLSEIHHTSACYYYWASHTQTLSNLNICGIGNNVD